MAVCSIHERLFKHHIDACETKDLHDAVLTLVRAQGWNSSPLTIYFTTATTNFSKEPKYPWDRPGLRRKVTALNLALEE